MVGSKQKVRSTYVSMIDVKNVMESVYRKYDLVDVPNYLSKKILFDKKKSLES